MIKEAYAIAIMVGSPNSTVALVRTTFESIRTCFSPGSYRILLQIGTKIPEEVRSYLQAELAGRQDLLLLGEADVDWSHFINHAIDEAEGCRYFIKSHDDIEVQTMGFDQLIDDFFAKAQVPVGWVSFTDTGYRQGDFSPPVREGYFDDVVNEDAFNRMRIFQFHNLPAYWAHAPWPIHYAYLVEKRFRRKLGWRLRPYPKRRNIERKYPIDLPQGPVRCHAPFNHFVLIRYDTLRKIGYCENWGTKNALLVDEDWGLRALQLGFSNVWIPGIEYFHNRGNFGEATRSNRQISQDAARVADLFAQKWGFHETPLPHELEIIRKNFGDTLIVWSMGRNSYDWDYILAE